MELLTSLEFIAALVAGGTIGLSFGKIQEAARLRNEKRQQDERLKSGWAVMPGSGGRVAALLLTLVLLQVICPLLFTSGVQWFVSAGVVCGYGFTLFLQLRQKLAARK